MLVREIDYHAGSFDRSPMAHVEIDGAEYLIVGGRGYVTVLAGRQWIKSRRALGRTFWSPAELAGHYRQHGEVLLGYANRVASW